MDNRFWDKVDKTGDCWNWKASKSSDGYGAFGYERRVVGAHRYSYELSFGKIPSGMCVLHKCDNPICVNPNHLVLGTHNDNVQDRVRKERSAVGENNGGSRLRECEVLEIRRLYSTKKVSQSILGKMFRVTDGHIGKIVSGEKWSYLPKESEG